MLVPVRTDARDRIVYDIPIYCFPRGNTGLKTRPVRMLKHPESLGFSWVDTILFDERDGYASERLERYRQAR